MNILKCKICGGNILLTGESHGICDSCGSEITLPKIDDDKRVDMYNRGNHFRQIGDFDRAYSAYEHIIADDRNDAEAHWCLTLCRYGVEYVKDVRSGAYKPTISRMNFERVLDDPDFQAALNCSDDYTKLLYTKEAQKIDNIQRRYLEISRQEQPYDVFICFKAEDTDGQRTQASVLSQEIYEKLTAKGLNVFFSRISLESKLSEEYEPYIFAALHSATVMLLVSDKPEQLTARWVKNEWSRYLAMMDRDSNKHIIPVFINMSPYDFPPEIPTVQGQDMSRVGAMQDLVRGVCKITNHLQEASSSPLKGAFSIQNCLNRIKIAVEDGEFDVASRLIEDVLNNDSENGEAYYYCALSRHQLRYLPLEDCEKLSAEQRNSLIEDQYFNRAVQYGNEERKRVLNEFAFRTYELNTYTQIEADLQQKTMDANNRAQKTIASLINDSAQKNRSILYYRNQLERIGSKCSDQRKKLKNLMAYWNEVENPQYYVKQILEERYINEIKHLNDLRNYTCKFAIYDIVFGVLTSVLGIIISVISIFMGKVFYNATLDNFDMIFLLFLFWLFLTLSLFFFGQASYGRFGDKPEDSLGTIFGCSFGCTFILFVIMYAIIIIFEKTFNNLFVSDIFKFVLNKFVVFVPSIITIFSLIGVCQAVKQYNVRSGSAKYYSEVITPIIDDIVSESNNRWRDIIASCIIQGKEGVD
ncbi:MAG: TIR domain-containing protein [Lachnospiraceae bacterium]|nr:TIR domain-containing protein [Lachnospiraceae bacterium]